MSRLNSTMKRSSLLHLGSRISGARWLAALLPMLHSGCATGPSSPAYVSLPAPPSEEVREQLGVITIVGTELKATEFAQPMGKGHAAGKTALKGFVAAPLAGGAVGGGYGAAAGLFLAPVTGTAGAIYGAFAGMTKDDYQRIRTTLQNVAREANVTARLERGVANMIQDLTAGIAVAATNALAGAAPTTLELTPAMFKLGGPPDVNPPLTLVCIVRARLVRVTDGAELYSGEFNHRGVTHSLREWADDGGTRFREGISAACNELPAQIVERVFLVYPLPPSPGQSRIVPWTTKE